MHCVMDYGLPIFNQKCVLKAVLMNRYTKFRQQRLCYASTPLCMRLQDAEVLPGCLSTARAEEFKHQLNNSIGQNRNTPTKTPAKL